jgi:hypothetical protein
VRSRQATGSHKIVGIDLILASDLPNVNFVS